MLILLCYCYFYTNITIILRELRPKCVLLFHFLLLDWIYSDVMLYVELGLWFYMLSMKFLTINFG